MSASNGRPTLNVNAADSDGRRLLRTVISDTCRKTSDCGAVEMLGSGDSSEDGPAPGWYTATMVRWNNISDTVGSSSSDGKNVCVHGKPAGPWCRGLVWGIYLDGGQAGVTNFGNIIGATLHGAILDNAGGNNTHVNNIFLGDAESPILMDFGAPGAGAPRSVAGSIVSRNIFAFSNPRANMMAAQTQPFDPELKPNGSDYNLYWSDVVDAAAAKAFPGGKTLSEWSGKSKADAGPVTCANMAGVSGDMIVSSECSWGFDRNQTTGQFVARKDRASWNDSYIISLDCEGNWGNCDAGTPNTRICMNHYNGDWAPIVPGKYPGQVQNSAWNFSAGAIRNQPNGHCVEVCERGGSVGGCDGKESSIVQLRPCTGSPKQTWTYEPSDGTFRSKLGTDKAPLCLANPTRPPPDTFDRHSIIADPLFRDAAAGDFTLHPDSPAIKELGFEPIPPIEAPTARCGGNGPSCLPFAVF